MDSQTRKPLSLRNQCRQALAAHLRQRLGIIVNAPDITLVPRFGHMYRWIYPPHRAFFFSKNLARHSPTVCQRILNEIDVTFLACKVGVSELTQRSERPATMQYPLPSGNTVHPIRHESTALITTPSIILKDMLLVLSCLEGYVQSELDEARYCVQEIRRLIEELQKSGGGHGRGQL